MTYCEMESTVGVTSCRSRELLFYSPTAAYGFPGNLCVGPRSVLEMTYASLRSRIETCTLAGRLAAPNRRFMECVCPLGRVSRNSFALVVCNEPVRKAGADSCVCTSLPWCSPVKLLATSRPTVCHAFFPSTSPKSILC